MRVGFLLGCVVSLIAAIPAIGLLYMVRARDFRVQLRNWAFGMAIRFLIIGAALFLVFTRSEISRMPVIWGVVAVYFLVFAAEVAVVFRRSNQSG